MSFVRTDKVSLPCSDELLVWLPVEDCRECEHVLVWLPQASASITNCLSSAPNSCFFTWGLTQAISESKLLYKPVSGLLVQGIEVTDVGMGFDATTSSAAGELICSACACGTRIGAVAEGLAEIKLLVMLADVGTGDTTVSSAVGVTICSACTSGARTGVVAESKLLFTLVSDLLVQSRGVPKVGTGFDVATSSAAGSTICSACTSGVRTGAVAVVGSLQAVTEAVAIDWAPT